MTEATRMLDALEANHPSLVSWRRADLDYGCVKALAVNIASRTKPLRAAVKWPTHLDGEAEGKKLIARALRRKIKRLM